MSESKNQSGFKLLAIRPLKNTSSDLLKGLQENCIYRFYNDYKYLDTTENEPINQNEYYEIKNIKYTYTVPSNLYGENISISAIVGENGSGKSSLMELIYYATLLCNKALLNKKEKDFLSKEFNIELIIQASNALIKIIKIDDQSIMTREYIANCKENEVNYIFQSERDFQINDFNFYSNILNYSIYGLNSNILPWIDLIFYKNDAYQMPIVINPFKEYGNYDINKEYMLMQSRAVFYTYVLGFKEIIKGIYINKIDFEIDINKILYIDSHSQQHPTHEIFTEFLRLNINKKNQFDYNNSVFKNNDLETINFKTLRSFLEDTSPSKDKNIFKKEVMFYNKDLLNTDLYKALTYLYIFKKLFKISKTYKKYKKYHFLFSNKAPFSIAFVDATKAIKLGVDGISPSATIDQRNLFTKEIHYENLMLASDLTSLNDISRLSEEDLYFFREEFMSFYRINHSVESKISKHLENINNDSNIIQNTQKLIEDLFNGVEFRNYLFQKYLYDLQKDNSHVTFKLNQAIKYFEHNIFNHLDIQGAIIIKNNNNRKISLKIEKDYFKDREKIEDIPLAVFNHILQVIKTGEDNEEKRNKLVENGTLKVYPYTSLSSGEQHLINSMLTIAYHNYNLLSVEQGNDLIKYKNINLIFDELELYLHPEYQRSFISNLINILEKIKVTTNQNDISYNVMMVTHSPFILSDIPSQNVLKLKGGKPEENDKINSFAANIYDLLKDEFFLKDGAIGAFASKKISEVSRETLINKQDLDIVNLIGDPFLKNVVKKKMEDNIPKDIIEKEIKRLSLLLNKDSTNATN